MKLKKKLNITALTAGIIALIIAISTSSGGVTYDKEKISLLERGFNYLKTNESNINQKHLNVDNSVILILSILSIVISIICIFIKEQHRKKEQSNFPISFNITGAALFFSLTALLWNYILIAIIVAIVFYILSSFFSGTIDLGI